MGEEISTTILHFNADVVYWMEADNDWIGECLANSDDYGMSHFLEWPSAIDVSILRARYCNMPVFLWESKLVSA